jgi:hypothetical protein
MLVLVEDSAEALVSSYLQVGDLVWIGDRRGQWVEWPSVGDALVGSVLVVEPFSKVVLARFARNDRLADALQSQALSALTASPGARAYYDKQRARGLGHNAALRQVSNRLVGILHGCLKTSTPYDEPTAWPSGIEHTAPLAA